MMTKNFKEKVMISCVALAMMFSTSIAVYAGDKNNADKAFNIDDQKAPVYAAYVSHDGWKTQYDKNVIEVNETRDGAYFVYTGECAGTCYVGLSVVSGKTPREVLNEKTADWNPGQTIESEGFFNGDNWSYTRRLLPAAGEVPVYQMFDAAEYNGKVFLVESYETVGNNEEMDMYVSDNLSYVLNAVKFDNFHPQTQFANYAGTYEYHYDDVIDGQMQLITNTITLNPDHTGKMSFQDDIDIHWGSHELYLNPTWTDRNEFIVEGDNLQVELGDGHWVTFTRVEEEDLE